MKRSRSEPPAEGESAIEGGSDPGLAAGEKAGVGDGDAASLAADATGSAIAAVVGE